MTFGGAWLEGGDWYEHLMSCDVDVQGQIQKIKIKNPALGWKKVAKAVNDENGFGVEIFDVHNENQPIF